jgi:hypothetical protein
VPRELLFDTVTAAIHGIALEPRYAGAQRIERVLRFPSDGRLTAAGSPGCRWWSRKGW